MPLIRRSLTALTTALAGLAGGCAPVTDGTAERWDAITNGEPAPADEGVVALTAGGALVCTGTLVAPRVVVTAAHCFGETPADVVAFGLDAGSPSTTAGILDVRLAPDYHPSSQAHDVALVLLDRQAPAMPWPVLDRAMDASFVGAPLRLVGFGATGVGTGEGPAGTRRQGWTMIDAVTELQITFDASPSQTCGGDSGGPGFLTIDGVEMLAGVTTGGDPGCALHAEDARIDIEVEAFVRPYLEATAEGAAAPGERCWYAENCSTGECFTPEDAPGHRYCTAPCASDGDCPQDMICRKAAALGGSCRWPEPSPGARGAPCASNEECDGGMRCARVEGGGALTCRPRCIPENPDACDGGEACGPDADMPNVFVCSPPGGCAMTPAPSGRTGTTLLVLLPVLGLTRRRHARRPAR